MFPADFDIHCGDMDIGTRLLILNRNVRVQRRVEPVKRNIFGNSFQEPYESLSRKEDANVMVPKWMKHPMRQAMERVAEMVGDVDEFVTNELGYESVETMHGYFMGLQVDAIAGAICQIRAGNSIIVADQTGIGKGRTAAAICRWTVLNGMIPIFFTYSDTLFTDFQRDLEDIDFGSAVWPLLFNADATITEQRTGRKIFGNNGSMKSVFERITETGELPRGRNAAYLTYSQVNVKNRQQKALTALATKAVFILDESHNAGGESNTGVFMQELLAAAKGVMFLSATWAKRPDNLPLYAAKTDIRITISDRGQVAQAIRAGGDPLQIVISSHLAQGGQLVRRERSFDGISILNFIDESNRELHEQISDVVTEALRAISDADTQFHAVDFERLRKRHKQMGERITHHRFAAIVHNLVKQFILALKSDAAADCAIESIRNNEKPIITLESTMGSFLDGYVQSMDLKEGALLDKLTWSTILHRALNRTLHYTGKNCGRVDVPLTKVCESTRLKYKDAALLLDKLAVPLPVSPIDYIRWRITEAGFSVAEITGREYCIDYSGTDPILSKVSKEEQNDRVNTGSCFNNGSLDCLILNQAGSTGISLHASEKFLDQRIRHMIVAQPAGDVNIFMQMLGRSNRTGQTVLPKYTMLSLALPAEIRPSMNLAKKLKSLNANTSSNTRSALSVDAPDVMNKYGDQVVAEWLHDNPQVAKLMGLEMDKAPEDGGVTEEDLARTATGRSALLPVKEQREFMESITESYNDYIAYLDETGQNDLEPKTYDFDAQRMTSHRIYEGSNPESPFGQDANYGEYSIKRQGRPYTPEEIEALLTETFGENAKRPAKERDTLTARDLDHRLQNMYKPFLAGLTALHVIERAGRIREMSRALLNEFRVGTGLRVDINGDTYNGIIYRIDTKSRVSGNPFAPSSLKFCIALNGALKEVRVPGSKLRGITVSNLGRNSNIRQLFQDHFTDARQRVKIITGNLLGAYGHLKCGTGGRIISFTTADGIVKQGILMPFKFNWETDVIEQVKGSHSDYAARHRAVANLSAAVTSSTGQGQNTRLMPSR